MGWGEVRVGGVGVSRGGWVSLGSVRGGVGGSGENWGEEAK